MSSFAINSEVLIVGSGDVIKNGTVVVQENKILYAGEQEHAPEVAQVYTAPVVLPGLWDAHCHYWGIKRAAIEELLTTNPYVAAFRSTQDVIQTLRAGFTSVREVGGFGVYLNTAIQEGSIEGPRIYGAGSILSMTGGHADIHNTPLEILENIPLDFLELVDGVAGCLRGTRKQIRKGVDLIKVCASGGVLSQKDHPIHQQLSLEELKAIVEEAARADLGVAAHCHGRPGIKAALEAGVLTIEHGTYLDEELADFMVEHKRILVPTRYVVEKLLTGAKQLGLQDYALAKAQAIGDRHLEAVRLAIKKGVTIATGTDIFTSGENPVFRWGQNAQELEYLVKAGMTPSDVIVAATGNGPKTLGPRAPKSGLLKAGYDADILLLNKNPLTDIICLTKKEHIIQIYKQGKPVF